MSRIAPLALLSAIGSISGQEAVRASFDPNADHLGATRLMDVRVDDAVAAGLKWLANQQNKNGFWLGEVGAKGRGGYHVTRNIEDQIRNETGHLGVTAFAGIAFLAGGHVPNRGRYGKVVQKTVDAVLSSIRDNGYMTLEGTRMYSHAFAMLFLAEVYGMTGDTRVKQGLEQATHIVIDTQNAVGGWRYNPFTQDTDLSVTVSQVQALRAARNIGIDVPKNTIDEAVKYVVSSRVTSGGYKGRFNYTPRESRWGGRRRSRQKQDHYAIQAAAVTALLSAGVYDRELIEPVMEFLSDEMYEVATYEPHHYNYWYGNYYASQAFFHAEGVLDNRCFERYYVATRDHLISDQRPDGRWLNRTGPGDAWSTAVACILLQIPKQYLPIFQR